MEKLQGVKKKKKHDLRIIQVWFSLSTWCTQLLLWWADCWQIQFLVRWTAVTTSCCRLVWNTRMPLHTKTSLQWQLSMRVHLSLICCLYLQSVTVEVKLITSNSHLSHKSAQSSIPWEEESQVTVSAWTEMESWSNRSEYSSTKHLMEPSPWVNQTTQANTDHTLI